MTCPHRDMLDHRAAKEEGTSDRASAAIRDRVMMSFLGVLGYHSGPDERNLSQNRRRQL